MFKTECVDPTYSLGYLLLQGHKRETLVFEILFNHKIFLFSTDSPKIETTRVSLV